jgi:hypothetical protein
VLQQLQTDFDNGLAVPDPDQLNAAVYGYPSKALRLGTKYQPFPDTQYDLLYVFAQYDGVADFPDNPFNLLAVTNAVMGGEQLHVEAANYPILTQSTYYNQTTSSNGGTTTIVMIPTPVLPLLQPMLDAGADPAKVAALDAKLRPKIDRAYNRPQFQYGVIAPSPPGVIDYPPGYTPPATPPPPASTMTTTAADLAAASADASSPASAPVGAPKTTDQAINKLLAENATTSSQRVDVRATDVVTADSSLAASATTTEQATAGEQSGSGTTSVASSSQPATDSSSASADDAGSQNGSTSSTSHVKTRAAKAGSSASNGSTHSTHRKLGHRN